MPFETKVKDRKDDEKEDMAANMQQGISFEVLAINYIFQALL